MNERTNVRTYEKAAAKAQRTQKMSWPATNLLPLNQHALLLLAVVTQPQSSVPPHHVSATYTVAWHEVANRDLHDS
jgi:hypothetical protein